MVGFEELIEMIQTGEPVIYNDPYAGKTRYDYVDEIIISKSRLLDCGKMQLRAHLVCRTGAINGYAKYIERVV